MWLPKLCFYTQTFVYILRLTRRKEDQVDEEIKGYNKTIFESIKHIDEYGNEYQSTRELQITLDYKKW